MKRFSLLLLVIPLLSIASMAQTPGPSVATTASPNINQAVAAPSPSPMAESGGIPNLHWAVELLASAVMLGSVIGALWSLKRAKTLKGSGIGPRHIQFVSVCLIVPTILILGLEKVLTNETTATLIGGLAGYLLSGIGKWEPRKEDPPIKEDPTKGDPGDVLSGLPESPSEAIEVEIQVTKPEDQANTFEARMRRLKATGSFPNPVKNKKLGQPPPK